MKNLYIIRHAKSSWTEAGLTDFERSLDTRGHKDAAKMSMSLKNLGIQPDLIVSSPAMRAATTAQYFAKTFNINAQTIDYQRDIYEASEEDVFNVIHHLPDTAQTVFLFGHNPTLTYFVNRFMKNDYIDNIPTCGIVKIAAFTEGVAWKNFNERVAQFEAFWYPKMGDLS